MINVNGAQAMAGPLVLGIKTAFSNTGVQFLKSTGLDVHLKVKDWAAFAKGYNGPKHAENQYDVKLAQAYKAFSTK